MKTIPGILHLLKPLNDAINSFIKVSLQGYALNPTERILFSLPAKYSGMALIILSEICQNKKKKNIKKPKEKAERCSTTRSNE